MPSQKHVHSYIKFKKRPGYYRCVLPDCTHFDLREAIVGKYCECPDCRSTFVLDYDVLKLAVPKCLNCRKTKKARLYQQGQQLYKNLPIFQVGDGVLIEGIDSALFSQAPAALPQESSIQLPKARLLPGFETVTEYETNETEERDKK